MRVVVLVAVAVALRDAAATTAAEAARAPSRPARGLGRLLHDRGARGVRAQVRRRGERRREALVRRLGRARRADPPGRARWTSTRRRTPSCPTSSTRDGLLEQPVEFATNEFVLAVPKDSDIGSDRRPDEGGHEDRDRLGVGADRLLHARDARRSCRPTQEKAILANVRSNEPDVKGIVGKLTQGAADAGFVYVTDVNAAGGELKAIKLPNRPPAAGDLRRRGGRQSAKQPELAQGVRRRAHAGRMRRRAEEGGVRPGSVTRPAGSRSLLGACLAVSADLPDAADRRDLRELEPRRAARRASASRERSTRCG